MKSFFVNFNFIYALTDAKKISQASIIKHNLIFTVRHSFYDENFTKSNLITNESA
jgi:hypothetical protein